MTPREADPNGANSGGGAAGLDDERGGGDGDGVDTTEREIVTSGIAQTSEVADRDAQDQAEGQGDGTPDHR